MSLANLAKVLKCAGGDDIVTLKANDDGDTVTFMFESPSAFSFVFAAFAKMFFWAACMRGGSWRHDICSKQQHTPHTTLTSAIQNHQKQQPSKTEEDRVSDFELKLMDIDSEHLGIPDTDYCATVTMPAGEYARIMRDLSSIGDTVVVSATKDGVKFTTSGDVGTANVTVRQNTTADKKEDQTVIDLKEPVSLTFALRYLTSFSKATPLATHVTLSMTRELPIMVEYAIQDMGHLRFYLAPKIEDEDMEGEDEVAQ
jgi:hypothetical protein